MTQSETNLELPESLMGQIRAFTDEGEKRFEAGDYSAALPFYGAALKLVPSPQHDWSATTWIAAALGDAHFFLSDFASARKCFELALRAPGGLGNPFIHLRLGECALELGDSGRAADELIRAYGLEGRELFASESPKYFDFLKTRAGGLD